MVKKLLVDASHREQIRIVVLDNGKVTEYDGETANKQQIKGNIYLAKVTRIEPSLQAAFVEYGGKKHGFLPFSEIHPDYYNIPVADKQRLLASVMPHTDDAEDDHVHEPDVRDEAESAYERRTEEEDEEAEARAREEEEEERGGGADDPILPAETAQSAPGAGRRRRRRRVRSSARMAAEGDMTDSGEETEDSANPDALRSDIEFDGGVSEHPEGETEEHETGEGYAYSESPFPHHEENPHADEDAEEEEIPQEDERRAEGGEEGEGESAPRDEAYQAQRGGRRRIASAQACRRGGPGGRHHGSGGNGGPARSRADDEAPDEEDSGGGSAMRRSSVYKRYKIQDVIRRGQILLVQVEKEERGHKGASVTTFVSLAGKYCVLMPNALKKGGVSRKVTNGEHRKQLKTILGTLDIKPGTGVIVRTAGAGKTREQIFSDYDYLAELWNSIRKATLSSDAPAFIHAEEDAVRRAIRDLYDDDFEEALIEGRAAYDSARQFIATMMPEHRDRVKLYEGTAPLFNRYRVEEQINALYEHTAPLDSGGSIVISPTEALISIDVNSGKSTSQRDVEETALTTNLEAAYEIARQLKLRDLSGLIVIDFIDMLEYKNRKSVERALKEAFSDDRARVQLGRISNFGLLEMSRQRLRPSLMEMTANPCPVCRGTGLVKSAGAVAVQALRAIEHECTRTGAKAVKVTLHSDVAAYIFNYKREQIDRIEHTYGAKLLMVPVAGDRFSKNQFSLQRIRYIKDEEEVRSATEMLAGQEEDGEATGYNFPDDREEREGETEGGRFKRILRAQERESRGAQGRDRETEPREASEERKDHPEPSREEGQGRGRDRHHRRRDNREEPRPVQAGEESSDQRSGGGRERLRRGGSPVQAAQPEEATARPQGGRREEGRGRRRDHREAAQERHAPESSGFDARRAERGYDAPRGFQRILEGLLRKLIG